jgi:hypothetical protein
LPMLVLDPPLKLPDTYAERLVKSRPKMVEGAGSIDGRRTPLAKALVDGVPKDGSWYLAGICYSQGQATALSSHISRGAYASSVETAVGPIPNKNKRGLNREHAVLLKRPARRGAA